MLPSPDTCYRALVARDRRFDGRFFVAVRTTGIYCRPICPARTPGESRCEFFASGAEAERAGYRACFRCRPELAPGLAPIDSVPRLVRAAGARIDSGYLNEHSVDELAAALSVSARHLRRAVEETLGVSPVELAQTRRLALAKQLLHDTALPLGEVAHHAGFQSLRRFNALTRARWGRSPSSVRRSPLAGAGEDALSLRLDCRPPFDWDSLLDFLQARAIPGVEQVVRSETESKPGRVYERSASVGGRSGWVSLSVERPPHVLRARISLSLAPALMEVVARLRATFDLDARPEVIQGHLRADAVLGPLLVARRGLRLPGAFDGFELGVRAILGQQISVAGATTLSGRLVERFGNRLGGGPPGLDKLFPTAGGLAEASLADIRAIGLPEARARTIQAFAAAAAAGEVELSPAAFDPEQVITALQGLPGIGPWTAHYIAMRALHWPNAFPADDLAIRRALEVTSAREAEARASGWQPWRGYAAMHLWTAAGAAAGAAVRTAAVAAQ